MGRGSSGAAAGSSASKYVDDISFNGFVRSNLGNPDFMELGSSKGMDAVREAWYEVRLNTELSDVHRMSREDAIDQVRGAISTNVLDGWFRNADSDYKPKLIESILSSPGTLNAGLNIAYENYLDGLAAGEDRLSFKQWVVTPQTLYRGEYGQGKVKSDIFSSYSRSRTVAASFGSNITTVRIRPIDTLGSYQLTGEQEYLVPAWKKGK